MIGESTVTPTIPHATPTLLQAMTALVIASLPAVMVPVPVPGQRRPTGDAGPVGDGGNRIAEDLNVSAFQEPVWKKSERAVMMILRTTMIVTGRFIFSATLRLCCYHD